MRTVGFLLVGTMLSLARADLEMAVSGPVQATKGSLIGSIAIEEEMHFEMDITVHSIPGDWANVFHCGNSKSRRLPGMWLHPTSGTDGGEKEGFHTCWTHDGDSDDARSTSYVTAGQTYHLEIDITPTLYTITQDGVEQYSGPKQDHTTYDSMDCYVSDPWYDAADVTVSNIMVWSGAIPTPEPTIEPTRDCSVFHIDEFLMDCSVEFDGHDSNIKALQDEVSSVKTSMGVNTADLTTLKDTVAQLVTATATMADSIDKINDELELVTEALDRMGDWP